MRAALLDAICEANRRLPALDLASLTWGNVSGRDPDSGLIAIKPSGVEYPQLTPESLVVLTIDGEVVSGELRSSSDTATHLALYRAFPDLGGIVHTHSPAATTLCQLGVDLPVLGTTHADHFDGTVPLVRTLSKSEVAEAYELNTAVAIIDHFRSCGIDPRRIPAALQHLHAPFVWGKSVSAALENAVALEMCAAMALQALAAGQRLVPIPDHILRKHQDRKHGPGATYGQKPVAAQPDIREDERCHTH